MATPTTTTAAKSAPATVAPTTAPVAPKTKLPTAIYYRDEEENEVKSAPVESVIKLIANDGDEGARIIDLKLPKGVSAKDVAKRLLVANIKSLPNEAEIPGEFEGIDLSTANSYAHNIAKGHADIKAELDEVEKTKKQQKSEEQEKERKEKEARSKQFAINDEEFQARFKNSVEKSIKTAKATGEKIASILKLPGSISMANGGMGVMVAENATRDDIALATANAVVTYEGIKNSEGAIQFIIGDLVNASVKAGIYEKKGDAASSIKVTLQEKIQKKLDVGTIQAYALMSERTPVGSRMMGVKPSSYLAISKVTPPRIKGKADSALEAEIETFRQETIERLNSGELGSKELAETIETFKVNKGIIKPKVNTEGNVNEYLKKFFMASFLASLADKSDNVKVFRGNGKDRDVHTYSLSELAEVRDEAYQAAVTAIIGSHYDVDALIAGVIMVDDKKNEGKKKEEIYRMVDPFFTPEKKDKSKDEQPAQVEEVEEEEDEASNTVDF